MKGWSEANIEQIKNKGLKVTGLDSAQNTQQENKELCKKVKRKMRHEESELQIKCVEAFRFNYPDLKYKLFAIPNGGFRNIIEASRMVREGILHGVLDLLLIVPNNEYHGLFIEVKTASGRLSEYQIQFIKNAQPDYKCAVIRTVEQFLKEVNEYLQLK